MHLAIYREDFRDLIKYTKYDYIADLATVHAN